VVGVCRATTLLAVWSDDAIFLNHRDEVRAVDLGLAAFLCVTSIEALTHAAVFHRRIVSDDAMEALVEEATHLVVGYLTS